MNQVKQLPKRKQPCLFLLFFILPLLMMTNALFAYSESARHENRALKVSSTSLQSFFVPLTQEMLLLTAAIYTFGGNTADSINYIELCNATDNSCSNCTAGFTSITTGTPISYLSSGTTYSIPASSLAAYLSSMGLADGSYNIGMYVRASGLNCTSAHCSANSDTNSHLLCMQALYSGGIVTSVSQTDNGIVQLNTKEITPTILANSSVTNTGTTGITGDVDVVSGTSVTGSPMINGTIHLGPGGAAAIALANAEAAYNAAVELTCPPANDLTGQDLGGLVLSPGVYCFSSSAQLTGTLTLAGTSTTSSYTFQIASTLITASNSSVVLTGGVTNDNIMWAVGSSATFGTNTAFAGIVNAVASISLNTDTLLRGRAWAQNGAVTLDNNSVNPD